MKKTLARLLLATVLVGALSLVAPLRADARSDIDVSKLVPTLSASFAPWDCRHNHSGIVCSGERHQRLAPEEVDFGCVAPVWDTFSEDRHQTRYYNHDNLNYFRRFRTLNIDSFAETPSGPIRGVISSRVRFVETFDILGDDQTITVTSAGVLYDFKPAGRHSAFRMVGTLIEPYNGEATFTGKVTDHGTVVHYRNAPFAQVLPEETFLALVCEITFGP